MRILDTFNKTFQYIKKELHNIKLFKSTTSNYVNHYITAQIIIKRIYCFSLPYIRLSEKTINFNDKKINKRDAYNNKKQFKIKDIDISKTLVSKPESWEMNAKKYIIGYNDDVIRPLHIFFLK